METVTPIPLTDRLAAVADLWGRRNDAPVSRIGRAVLNDPNFFKELGIRVKGPGTRTVEQLAAWLADPANWPEGEVPQEAIELAHVVGVSPVAVVPDALAPADADSADGAGRSAGRDGEISPREQAA